jgi:uncharacterized protein (DUF2237 family)
MKSRDLPGRGNQLNVLGGPLLTCSDSPLTGFFRDGCCNTSEDDFGSHTVCVVLTDEFLAYSKAAGNDLSTPRAGKAPKVSLNSTNQAALEIVPLDLLKQHAVDLH